MSTVDQRHREALRDLHPVFRTKVDQLLVELLAKGWQPVLVYGRSTEAQRRKLAAEGVGAKRSWHVASTHAFLATADRSLLDVVRGCAADVIDRRWGWSGPCANKNHKFWNDLGASAKRLGLEWGGDWKKRDVAHVQLKFVEDAPRSSVVV